MAIKLLGYIFLFYVGFYFWRLAENHNKNRWLYAFLGIVTYFVGLFLYVFYVKFIEFNNLDEFDLTVISLKSFISGTVFTVLMFQFLNFIWNKKKNIKNEDIDKIGK